MVVLQRDRTPSNEAQGPVSRFLRVPVLGPSGAAYGSRGRSKSPEFPRRYWCPRTSADVRTPCRRVLASQHFPRPIVPSFFRLDPYDAADHFSTLPASSTNGVASAVD
jgi:hypothetical protein